MKRTLTPPRKYFDQKLVSQVLIDKGMDSDGVQSEVATIEQINSMYLNDKKTAVSVNPNLSQLLRTTILSPIADKLTDEQVVTEVVRNYKPDYRIVGRIKSALIGRKPQDDKVPIVKRGPKQINTDQWVFSGLRN